MPTPDTPKFFTREAVDRIVEAAGGLPEPSEDDPRGSEERLIELQGALDFAADRLITSFVANRVRPQGKRPRGRPREQEIQEFVDDLHEIWLDVFGKRFRTSFDRVTGKATGPFIGFLSACFLGPRDEVDRSRIVHGGMERPDEQRELRDSLGASSIALRRRSQRGEPLKIVKRLEQLVDDV